MEKCIVVSESIRGERVNRSVGKGVKTKLYGKVNVSSKVVRIEGLG